MSLLLNNKIKTEGTTILTLQLFCSTVELLHYYANKGYIDIDEYVTYYIESEMKRAVFQAIDKYHDRQFNEYGEDTLPIKVSLPNALAFKLGLLSRRMQVPIDFIVEEALEDIIYFGYDYVYSNEGIDFTQTEEFILRDILRVRPDFTGEIDFVEDLELEYRPEYDDYEYCIIKNNS